MTTLATLGLSAEAIALRPDWIGGSDANTIMSGNDARIIRLWQEKRREAEPEDLSGNLAVQMGSFTEPLNCAWFEKHTGLAVHSHGKVLTTEAHGIPMRCTLDGIVDGGIFEAKHCGTRNTDAELFARYVPQLTHNCIVAGERVAYLSIFKGNADWVMFTYDLDDDYAARLIEAERAFWNCVQTGEPPAPLPEAPKPKPRGVIEYDMETSNAWAALAADYLDTILAAGRHETAKKGLKELVPDDASKAFGHGITIKRDARGALRFSTGE